MKDFTTHQQQSLKALVQQGVKTSLFAHLGLVGLKQYRDFDLLHQAFAQSVPVNTPAQFQNLISDMTNNTHTHSADVIESLMQKQLTTPLPLAGLCYWENSLIPVTKQILKDYYAYEKSTFKCLKKAGVQIKGGVFTLFEREKYHAHGRTGMPVTGWNRLIQENRPLFGRQQYLPQPEHLLNATGSRFQWFNAMLDLLKKQGSKIEVLIAHPATLVDFALFAAQQEGRFVPLSDLCPNLKVFLYTSNSLSPYRTELAYCFNTLMHVRWVQFYHNPAGLFIHQKDLNVRNQLSFYPTTRTFLEFIPEEDVQADGTLHKKFRRLHSNQLQAKRRYVLLLNNSAGLLGIQLNQLVFVKNTEPLQIILHGSVKQLNVLGEKLREYDMINAIDSVNTTLSGHGLFIRNFIIGTHAHNREPRWLFEMSRPVETMSTDILMNIAERLKSEILLKNPQFREFISNPNVQNIKAIFVPIGSLATVSGDQNMPKFDHSKDAHLIEKVLVNAWNSRSISV